MYAVLVLAMLEIDAVPDVLDSMKDALKTHCLHGHPRTPENLSLRSCKICARERDKAARRKRRLRNPARYLLGELRRAAKSRGQEFTIKLTDILPLPKNCPVLGIELDYSGAIKRCSDNLPSIDRRNPKQGYVPGNVAVISYRANRIKNNATVGEIEKILEWMKRGS